MCIRDGPTGFATTAHAFREFLTFDGLTERINARLDALDTEDVRALAEVGAEIRAMVENPVSYTHLRTHETVLDLVCRLLLEKQQNLSNTLTIIAATSTINETTEN